MDIQGQLRPFAVLIEFWSEVVAIEEDADLLEPVYVEVVS